MADIFGVSRETIRNWVNNEHLSKFFSEDARAEKRTQADFSENDMYVLNSIHSMVTEGNRDWRAIAENLASGWRETSLPERAASVTALHAPAMQLAARAFAAETRAVDAKEEVSETRRIVLQLTERLLGLEGKNSELLERHMKEKEILLREMGDLREQIGKLKGKLGEE